ncbi:dynein axonemal heavy chain 2 [Hylaeus volcanicus]|uniref:dynein axonemal heavy chain 2 n=1 Tax=Hylaeus volcanicus TaxID=313075 RepID=UPI0023B7E0EE|nr:dynein axonemal heavy chain 2 [Hylaeus volcanicus]
MQRQKVKAKDQPPPDPRREYLDAESTDDEERHKLETAELEEELRPVYDDEELSKLVTIVKEMTTLSDLSELEWTSYNEFPIREFFLNPGVSVLTVYYMYRRLTASLGFPVVPVHELTYFVREPHEIFRADSFRDRVLFGTLNTKVESHILSLADFYTSVDTFLCSLTDLAYKMLGLTVIYVPREGDDVSTGVEASADKELVKRLEGVVAYWTTQIRIALSDQEQATPNELLCLEDEHEFWVYRYDNLCGLNYQLQNTTVKKIAMFLTANHSTYVRQFVTLKDEIEHGVKEAISNIGYLRILKPDSEKLNKCTDPADIEQHLTKIIHLFRTIWLNSPYYNSQERIENLFKALSNQVVIICRKYVDLKDVFAGRTRKSMETFRKCVEACENYKTLYEKIAHAHTSLAHQPWDLNMDNIFRHIDIFIGRCHDMIEICQAMIDFARMDETAENVRPMFSGTKGEEHERVCQKIERLFHEALQKIEQNSHKILDVHQGTWHENMFAFRSELKDLDIMVENLVASTFAGMRNVQEAIEDLQGFYSYMNREKLKTLFDVKANEIWKLFGDDIQRTKQEVLDEREEYPSMTPYYAGRALNLRLKGARLQSTREMLEEAAWIPYCGLSADLYDQHDILMKSIEDLATDLHNKWIYESGENPRARLDRFLMRWSDEKPGSIECNVDPDILTLCRECAYWINLNFTIPVHVQIVYDRWETLYFVYESVLAVVIGYNKVIEALSSTERELFRELIRKLDRKINPGLGRLTWNSEYVDAYIEDCFNQTANLQEFIDVYKDTNFEIMRICENICDSPMIKIRPNYTYTLLELEEELLRTRYASGGLYNNSSDVTVLCFRNQTFEIILSKHRTIIQHVLVIYDGFKEVIADILRDWMNYLTKIDTVIAEALRQCLSGSLEAMYVALHGDGTTPPSPFILMHADLIDNKINFTPSVMEISSVISVVFDKLLEPLKSIQPLVNVFRIGQRIPEFTKAYEKDSELLDFQQKLNDEISYCFIQIQNYLKIWEPFQEVWEVNRDMFIQRYEKLKPTAESYDGDIAKYGLTANNVQMQETVMTVHFLDVNADRLKGTIIEECSIWQQKLMGLLLRQTENMTNHVYHYIAENSKKISREPTDLISMQYSMLLYERLTAEIPQEEEEFPKIQEQHQVLEKYEVPLTFDFRRKLNHIEPSWAAYLVLLANSENMLIGKKEEFKVILLQDALMYKDEVTALVGKFGDTGPFTSDWTVKDSFAWIALLRREILSLKGREARLKSQLSLFGINQPDNIELMQLDKDLAAVELVWQITNEWYEAWDRYRTENFWDIDMAEMEDTANVLFRKLNRLSRELREKKWEILEHSRQQVDNFRRTLPLITDLKNPAMRPRHWKRLKDTIDRDFDETSETFTLELIAEMQLQNFAEAIGEISNAATMELAIEVSIKHIREIWDSMPIEMVPYKDRGMYRLTSIDDVMQTLDEHQVQLSAMKATRFVEPFAEEVDYWERTLSSVGEILEMTLVIQRGYIYMDNIFTTEDIRKQLPRETHDYDKLTKQWIRITATMKSHALALPATQNPPGLLEVLNKINGNLESMQRALEQYLETKRNVFPRFYFISNDDLLEILANARRPEMIQPHIKKLFENIKSLSLGKSIVGKQLAHGMFSHEGEYVDFDTFVILEGQVEEWLCEIETAMRTSLRDVLRQCRLALRKMTARRDRWVKEWPSQPGITSTQIQWTADCTRALLHCNMLDSRKPLKKLRKRQNQALSKYSEAIRSDLNRLDRLKFKAIVVIEIHARDVIEKMYRANCKDVSAFEWLSQLRFYWDKDIDDCIVWQTNTHFVYGYEYLGNTGRLVITPLTDRCYITLTTALHLYRGGSPKGPAGTGKTETVKDLGKALGFNVIVQNCSEGLDYKSMGRMFSGLSQTGAWGCFDEFNRINIEVLSVVAQQILSILTALSQKLNRFVFEGCEISLVHTCGIFITMNPGYAGRTELPDNLKSMFRPISMMVPDSSMIAEINLFGEGFENTRVLARKVYTLYTLAQQQLSKQYHYDFGLRGIVTLTRYAGKKKRLYPNLPDDEVIILAMKDMNIAKLTSDDLPLFLGITSDLFPDVEVPTVDYEEIISYITKEAIKLKLQPIPLILTKVIELYETMSSRHSTMIVGESNTAKTVTWRILQNTMTSMKSDKKPGFNVVRTYPINPKALSLGELYGEYNLSTGEWHDGVISSIMRNTCSDDSPDEKWILFDGPVDADWIENMNSVMDDNKVLTLINNDRITMPDQVSLLFEVQDLAVASPATVSRAGMVYNDYKDLGWKPCVESWLQKHQGKPEFVEEMRMLFEEHVNNTLEFKRNRCEEMVQVPELNAVQSLCKLLQVLATPENGVEFTGDRDSFAIICKMWFFFCMIWSLCGSVNEEGRYRVDNYMREIEGSFPLRDTVYEYFVDPRIRSFVSWEERLPQAWRMQPGTPFYKIVVPTVDTVRYEFIIGSLLRNEFPVLLVGPVGTGKTSLFHSVLGSLSEEKYSVLTLNMSAQTTSRNVQDTVESRLEKRTKGIYIPVGGKTMIAFMDDFNMPMKETYGSQPPLELIRQLIGYGFWYDRAKQIKKYIQRVQLMAAMGPPGGGRNVITNRLLTKFNVINMTFPVEKQIVRIYGTMLNQHLVEFHAEVKRVSNQVTAATISLYNHVVDKMLPTPAKMHYLFNLRDISKIFQGLLRSHVDYQYSSTTFLRLWIHEAFRVFSDRLIDERDRQWFVDELNEQLGKHFEMTFHNICPEKRCPLFGSFMNAWDMYEDLTDIAAVRTYIEAQMDEYNASTGVVRLDLILFRDAIEHICRIVRVVSQPRGNMLLIGVGGSGRQSLSRIASYMCELSIFQISVTKQYRLPEFREDLKILYKKTGVDNKPTTFLFNDTQVIEEQFLEVVNSVLSTGEVANLYKSDEMEEIRKQLTKEATRSGRVPTTESIYSLLIERARANMHLILCMSPIGDAFRNRLRQYPALINCTTIDWFLEWPREALLEVGNKFLMNLNLTLTITGENKVEPRQSTTAAPLPPLQDRMRDGIAGTFSLIHETVSQFSRRMAAEMKRYNYVTPVNFLELVAGYKTMLTEKRQNLADQANKLRNGLSKIDETRVKVNEMAAELEVTQEQVHKSTRECEEFLITIVNQSRDADETQKTVAARSQKIGEEQKECKKLEELARADLATVEPALNEAMKALDALSKKDISEIRSFTRPPPKVEMVMEAVMILKNSEPSWAESKRQLADVNFLNTLRDFDKDHISDRTLRAIARYTSNPEFDAEKVGQVSIAAKSLCIWVIAMEKYGKLYRIVAPKREKLYAALASLKQKEDALAEAMQQLEKLQEKLRKLQEMYDGKMREKEELIKLAIVFDSTCVYFQAELLKLKLERAAMLVDGLSDERIRWENTVGSLATFFDWLPGDCLISTAFVSYLGPFVSNYREELITIWMNEVQEKEIPTSPKLDVKEFLVDPAVIRDWNIQGLPSDDFSTENGIIVTRGTRWPLVIDPQCQATKWIKNMEAKNSLKVIDFGQADYTRVLEQALQYGRPVLLENIGETVDPTLNPILERALVKLGNQVMIKFNEKMITYNDNFRLFITTKLPNPHYAPEISTKTTLCNFAIKEQGLEDQLLGIVVRKEKPQLEEQKDHLVLTISTNKRTLKELEDKILFLLSVAGDNLLDDLDLLSTLQSSKVTSTSIEESLVVSEETEKKIDLAREEYRPCAQRAAILFFVLNDTNLIDPMYQFSLDAYITLFMLSIEKSPKSIKLAERIESLNEYHTYALYKNTCRGLFEHHKLLFSFNMCIKILDAQGKVMPAEYAFLLHGGIVLDRESQPDKPVPWMPDETWDNVTELDKLPGFHGFISSFEQFPRDWHAWYISTEPESIPLVAEWDVNCNLFQKMLVIRSCRPDRISFCIAHFIVLNLGQRFVEPPVLDLKAVLDDSVAQTPLIFVLSPGVDPTSTLMQLVDSQEMTNHFMTLSLGQGQSPIATRMIEVGAKEGAWVFLANCHLSLSWMPKLDKIVETLGSSRTLHPQFRLWLSSSPTPQFPISILQAGIKMTTEPPKGLRANMKRLYGLITEIQFELCQAKHKYKKLLFALVFFHAILLERKKFQQLGWNVVYSFNDSDFVVSENLLQVYLDEYSITPWESLKYLIAGVCYGGHVTDDWDRRLLMTYVQQYFNEEVLTVPHYRLSSLPTYYIPRDGSLESYRDFIAVLPSIDKPEAFGQHPNADITCLIMEARNMFETLMSLQVQTVASEEASKEEKVTQLTADILSRIPKDIDYETTQRLIGPRKTPLDVVLLQEIQRYNVLMRKTRNSLEELRQAIKGLVLMSSDLEDIFTCVYEGRVPSIWLTAYPSLKLLGAWTRDLVSRVEHFNEWARTTHPPLLFWLAAYTFPTGFLTAVLQTSARLWNVSIDSLSWEFTVFTIDESTIIEPPVKIAACAHVPNRVYIPLQDGVYIRSIFLEGAGWDKRNSVLVEPAPMQLVCDMPVIHFRPTEHLKKRTKGLYNSPCYYYPQRSGDGGRPSFVVAVDLNAGQEGSEFWVKRGTALLLSLST